MIVHGGAGSAFKDSARRDVVKAALRSICAQIYAELESGKPAVEVVEFGCSLLEDDPNFNAGTGSVIQADGQIRMTASIMDGARQAFSGVMNVQRVQHPIAMARHLNSSPDRVIAADGAALLAREMALPVYDPTTERRFTEWFEGRRSNVEARSGTIGVVAMDVEGRIAAGTSTGGRGLERIGRVSDSGMPAGNYATEFAGISCTGIGEDIIDECFAARVAVRVEDGQTLMQAMERSIAGCVLRERKMAAISVSQAGDVVWGKACDLLLAAWHDGVNLDDSVDAAPGPMTVQVA